MMNRSSVAGAALRFAAVLAGASALPACESVQAGAEKGIDLFKGVTSLFRTEDASGPIVPFGDTEITTRLSVTPNDDLAAKASKRALVAVSRINDPRLATLTEFACQQLGFEVVPPPQTQASVLATRDQWFDESYRELRDRTGIPEGCDVMFIGFMPVAESSALGTSRIEVKLQALDVGTTKIWATALATLEDPRGFEEALSGRRDSESKLLAKLQEQLVAELSAKGIVGRTAH